MSHITCQAQRDANARIKACEYRNVAVWKPAEDDGSGQPYSELLFENQCGDSVRISAAQDRCVRCGKTFTY